MPMSPELGEERQKPYREGGEAQRAGKPRTDVPYERGTLEHDDWQDGYSSALVGTHDTIPS